MVFGSILNWIVGRTLDFTLDRIIWVTKTTALGIITLGYYITSRNTNKIKNEQEQILELIPLTKVEIEMLKEQNNILKEELELLKKINPNLAIKFSEDLAKNKETNIDYVLLEKVEEKVEEKESNKVANDNSNNDCDYDSDSFV
jgi:hypothetical protein